MVARVALLDCSIGWELEVSTLFTTAADKLPDSADSVVGDGEGVGVESGDGAGLGLSVSEGVGAGSGVGVGEESGVGTAAIWESDVAS